MLGEVELLGGIVTVLGVKDAIVVDQAVKAVGMSVDPVHHVTTIRCTKGGDALVVNVGVLLQDVVQPLHQINVGRASPVIVDSIGQFLAVTG